VVQLNLKYNHSLAGMSKSLKVSFLFLKNDITMGNYNGKTAGLERERADKTGNVFLRERRSVISLLCS
jgi:hypothetical protein